MMTDFAKSVNEIEELYMQTLTGDTRLESLIFTDCLTSIGKVMSNKRDQMSIHSKTPKLAKLPMNIRRSQGAYQGW